MIFCEVKAVLLGITPERRVAVIGVSVSGRGFWLEFSRGPTCVLYAWWVLDLCTRRHWNRLFLRWSALQPGPWAEPTPRGPLLLFRVSRGLFPNHARTGRILRLVVRSSRDSPLRTCKRVALRGIRSWSGQRGSYSQPDRGRPSCGRRLTSDFNNYEYRERGPIKQTGHKCCLLKTWTKSLGQRLKRLRQQSDVRRYCSLIRHKNHRKP